MLYSTTVAFPAGIERVFHVFQIIGEKLSKDILQRNTNIKKLRTKEKELNASHENLRYVGSRGFSVG
jgi:hypothetical protein